MFGHGVKGWQHKSKSKTKDGIAETFQARYFASAKTEAFESLRNRFGDEVACHEKF